MGLIRLGIKVRLWSPRFKNEPNVHPPGLLRLVSVLSVFSIIGVLVYSIAVSITGIQSGPEPQIAAYVAILHFILPLSIAYTVSGNYPSSRILIALYCVVLYGATLNGIGFLGEIQAEQSIKAMISTAALAIIATWLFRSPKMRFYYTVISGKPTPSDLEGRETELIGHAWISPKKTAAIEWFADNLETVVLLGFVVVAIYALFSMSI